MSEVNKTETFVLRPDWQIRPKPTQEDPQPEQTEAAKKIIYQDESANDPEQPQGTAQDVKNDEDGKVENCELDVDDDQTKMCDEGGHFSQRD